MLGICIGKMITTTGMRSKHNNAIRTEMGSLHVCFIVFLTVVLK